MERKRLYSVTKNELESHGVQIYDTNYLGIKYDNLSPPHDTIDICDILIVFMIRNDTRAIYDVWYAVSKGKKISIIRADDSGMSAFLKLVLTILLHDYFDTAHNILNFVHNCWRQQAPGNITPK